APSVAVTAPADGSEVVTDSAVTISGTAADDVAVTQVEVLIDGVLLNTTVPVEGAWSLDWMPSAEVVVEISARAFDAAGNSAVSETVTVTVVGQGGTVGGVITRAPAEVGGGGTVDSAEMAP